MTFASRFFQPTGKQNHATVPTTNDYYHTDA